MINDKSINTPVIYTLPEAAKILRISKCLAYELAHKGILPVIRLGERRMIITQSALNDFLSSRDKIA